jgi:hypothetical protein
MKSLVAQGNCSSLGENSTLKQVLFSLAVLAEPKNLDHVSWFAKTVLLRNLFGPSFDLAGFDFDRLSAVLADQVVMVICRAGAVEELSLLRLQRVGLSG